MFQSCRASANVLLRNSTIVNIRSFLTLDYSARDCIGSPTRPPDCSSPTVSQKLDSQNPRSEINSEDNERQVQRLLDSNRNSQLALTPIPALSPHNLPRGDTRYQITEQGSATVCTQRIFHLRARADAMSRSSCANGDPPSCFACCCLLGPQITTYKSPFHNVGHSFSPSTPQRRRSCADE